ncbi:MAG: hypothetical protein H6Q81_945 [Deltaproteobacteria bacterium]|nr:hypothetical protein [Deltaproteobacteria bacterium]
MPLPHLHLDPAVLRETTLRDVEGGHDLESRRQGVAQPQRGAHDLVENAIHPVAGPELLFVRLDVDVRRAPLDRLGEEVIRQFHDGRVVDAPREVGGVDLLLPDDLEVLVEFGDDVPELHRAVEELVDLRRDLALGGENELHRVPRLEPDAVDDRHVGGVGHRNDHLRPHAVDGKGEVLLDHLLGEEADDLGIDLVFRKIDDREAELAAEVREELLFLDESGLHQDGSDPLVRLLLGFECTPQLVGADQVPFEKHFADLVDRHRHGIHLYLNKSLLRY